MVFDLRIIDWTALGSIATLLAVLVALFLPIFMNLRAASKNRYLQRRTLLTYLYNLRFLLTDILADRPYIAIEQFPAMAQDAVRGIENVYWNASSLSKDEQRLIGNLIIMITDPRFIYCRSRDSALLQHHKRYVDHLIELLRTYGIDLMPGQEEPPIASEQSGANSHTLK